MKKNGYTLIELLVTLIILGVLAAAGMSLFGTRIRRTRGDRAISNIELIGSAMQMYGVKYQQDLATTSPLSDINNTLNLELNDSNYSYTIDLMPGVPGDDDYNLIEATETATGDTIGYEIDCVDGDINGSSNGWDPNSSWPWTP